MTINGLYCTIEKDVQLLRGWILLILLNEEKKIRKGCVHAFLCKNLFIGGVFTLFFFLSELLH